MPSAMPIRNTGAAFGFLNTADFPFKAVVIPVIATAALIAVGMYLANLGHHQLAARIGLALIIGGAAGNLLDRVAAGYVVDFVDVYWHNYHFWAFNVADSAITANTTCPGSISESPSSRSTNSQCGGKIELTRTRLKFARWASRSAISKLVSFSLCRPTPFVRKALVGTNIRESINPSPQAH